MNKEKTNSQFSPSLVIGIVSILVCLISLVLPLYYVEVMGTKLNLSIISAIMNYGLEGNDQVLLFLLAVGLICIGLGFFLKSKGGIITGGGFIIVAWFAYALLVQGWNTNYDSILQYGVGFYCMLLSGIGGIVAGLISKYKA